MAFHISNFVRKRFAGEGPIPPEILAFSIFKEFPERIAPVLPSFNRILFDSSQISNLTFTGIPPFSQTLLDRL